MKQGIRWILLGTLVILVGIQCVPVDRSNPAVEAEVAAPANMRAILRRACYDCHSNETVWPWYSQESWKEVAEGEMPPWFYLGIHRDATLSAENRDALRQWAFSTASEPTGSKANRPSPSSRMQRTRPYASLRGSPLTRHPLGD